MNNRLSRALPIIVSLVLLVATQNAWAGGKPPPPPPPSSTAITLTAFKNYFSSSRVVVTQVASTDTFQIEAVNLNSKDLAGMYLYAYPNTTASGSFYAAQLPGHNACKPQPNGLYTCVWGWNAGILPAGQWSFKAITTSPRLKTLGYLIPGITIY